MEEYAAPDEAMPPDEPAVVRLRRAVVHFYEVVKGDFAT